MIIRDFIYISALLLTNESPLFKALAEDEEVLAAAAAASRRKTGRQNTDQIKTDLKRLVFGVPYGTMQKWITEKRGANPTTIRRLCSHFNEFRQTSKTARQYSQPLDTAELLKIRNGDTQSSNTLYPGYDAIWFQFAQKLGYDSGSWRDVQHHIESVFYQHSLRGHEFSCEEGVAEDIYNEIGGINYLYFVGTGAHRETESSRLCRVDYLVRASLRIRKGVRAANSTSKYYIPCRLKLPALSSNAKEWTMIEYIGKVTYKESFYYMTLLDNSTRQKDFVTLAIDSRKPYMNLFGGIYTSVSSVSKVPYSSAAVLENREHQLTEEERRDPYTTLNFMYHYTKKYVSAAERHVSEEIFSIPERNKTGATSALEDKLTSLSADQKAVIRTVLQDSPFVVDLDAIKKA